MILEELAPEKTDIIALGLSSQNLWQIILRRIHIGYRKAAAPWSGKMIAFQGSYSKDLPEPFEANGLAASITGEKWFGNMCAARRFLWAHRRESTVTPFIEESGWLKAARSSRDACGIPETLWETIEKQLGCSYLFPKDREWLLRNLTTREVISSRLIDGSMTRKTQSGDFPALSFDELLLMQSKSVVEQVAPNSPMSMSG